MKRRTLSLGVLGLALAAFLAVSMTRATAQGGNAPRIDSDDIGGVVTSTKGPEAGVWVIAETTDLPTKMARIVVTDDRGRYVIPDLPKGNYNVWVRGYGLVDSAKTMSAPGRTVNLTATLAPNPRAAAEYYPANYWYALVQPPDKSEFPGTGAKGNGISEAMRSQAMWINNIKTSTCTPCHQMGNKATREMPQNLGKFGNSVEAWNHRLQAGIDGGAGMYANTNRFGRDRVLKMFADWTDRVAGGELPQAPPRPQGVERNFVVTVWDWATDREYFHDAVASDKRNPTVNANGPVYGVHENSSDNMTILDPMQHKFTQVKIPVLDEKLQPQPSKIGVASPYWGEEIYWTSRVIGHSNVMDQKGRTWNTTRTRAPAAQPAFCKEGSTHPSAKLFPLNNSGRQYTVYDPATKQWTIVDTCFGTFHLNFAHDANNTIWSGNGGVVGWVNTKVLDESRDPQKAQGWAPLILDTNGNGKQDAWVEPDAAVDPTKDKRIDTSFYAIAVSPSDGAIWGDANEMPGAIVRVSLGSNPPTTTLAEIYEVPYRTGARTACVSASRLGRRRERRRLDRAGQRALRQLRSTQVQSTVERAECHRQAVQGGVVLLHGARSEFQGWQPRIGRRGLQLLQLGGQVRLAGRREERSNRNRQPLRRAARTPERQVGRGARAIPDRLLREADRWPHRRSTRWLEGTRTLDDVCEPNTVAHRRREGHAAEGVQVPDASGSTGALNSVSR